MAFEALFAEQSVTAASQRLHIGQSAMSAALGRLRLLFEDDLFVRTGRQMLPTSRAQEIAPLLIEALNQIREVLATPDDFDAATAQRTFSLGASDYLFICIAPPLLQMATRAGITWDLTHFDKNQVADVLERGGLDLALGTAFDLPAGILQSPLWKERLVGICRPGHLSPWASSLTTGIVSCRLCGHVPCSVYPATGSQRRGGSGAEPIESS